MANRDRPEGSDSDDWFAEPDRVPLRGAEAPRPAAGASWPPEAARDSSASREDWLSSIELPAGTKRRRAVGFSSSDRRAVAAAAVALVVLVIGLAAAGVFSGRSGPRLTATATRPIATTPARTTQPKVVSVQVPTTTFAPGTHGPEVKKLQQALARLGYSPGRIDGNYGPGTQAALVRFQRASGLTADGILGPNTLAALASALHGSG